MLCEYGKKINFSAIVNDDDEKHRNKRQFFRNCNLKSCIGNSSMEINFLIASVKTIAIIPTHFPIIQSSIFKVNCNSSIYSHPMVINYEYI